VAAIMQRRGDDLYLEVCVIDAFKDERWSSGLRSHHRDTESQNQVRKNNQKPQRRDEARLTCKQLSDGPAVRS